MAADFGKCEVCGNPLTGSGGVCDSCSTQGLTGSGLVQIPGLRSIRLLGAGGMGSVFLAQDEELQRLVAVKVMADEYAESGDARARFKREARAMATVEHPNVVGVYSFGEIDGQLYIVMEYVEGETLADQLRSRGQLAVGEALAVVRQVVTALCAGWQKKIIHRDIKPANILMSSEGQVRVADFGLAKPIRLGDDTTLTQKGYLLGTPQYSSPEQARGKTLDFRSDIYSLGIVLYELLFGEKPFKGDTPFAVVDQHLHEPLPSFGRRPPDVTAKIEKLIRRMTEKRPEDRFESYDELLENIDAAISSTDAQAPMRRPLLTAPSMTRSAVVAVTVAIAVTAITAGLALKGWLGRSGVEGPKPGSAVNDPTRFVVAVAPFYGPDEDSVKEGRIMASLVEKAVKERLPAEAVEVLGLDYISEPVRDHEQARLTGEALGATVVVWGEALALREETELRPFLTMVPRRAHLPIETAHEQSASMRDDLEGLALDGLQQAPPVTTVGAQATNQIELRRVSAGEIGDVVLMLAGFHALSREENPSKALEILAKAPQTPETLGLSARAVDQLGRREEAIEILKRAVALDPGDPQNLALMGDLFYDNGNLQEAVEAYAAADRTGATYTTTRAVVFNGLLYYGEMYRRHHNRKDGIEAHETSYLLGKTALAPRRVVERHYLPGKPVRFRSTGDHLEITYGFLWGGEEGSDAIGLREGRLTRPVNYSASLLLRLNSMRAGWELVENFIGHLSYLSADFQLSPEARFEPTLDHPGVPSTYHDLEFELEKAISVDPTQPWHVFWLGQSYWAQGHVNRAEELWARLTGDSFRATPYFEFAWMARYAEHLGQPALADAVSGVAERKRAEIEYAVGSGTSIERVIAYPPVRYAARSIAGGRSEVDRAHLWLRRARQVTGLVENDDVAAVAWREYFSSLGETEKARDEAEILRRIRRSPFDSNGGAALVDYATFFILAAVPAYWVLFFVIVVRPRPLIQYDGSNRPKDAATQDQSAVAGELWRIGGRWQILRTALTALVVAAMLWLVSEALGSVAANEDSGWLYLVLNGVVVVSAFLAITIRLRKATIRSILPRIAARERLALIIAFVVAVAAYVLMFLAGSRMVGVATMPIGLMDSPSPPGLIPWLEERLEESDEFGAIRYAAAVAHHATGDLDRARELYGGPGRDERAMINLERLERGQGFEPSSYGPEDVFAALREKPWPKSLLDFLTPWEHPAFLGVISGRALGSPAIWLMLNLLSTLAVALPLLMVVLIGCAVSRPVTSVRGQEAVGDRRVISKVFVSLVPGLALVNRGSAIVGWAVLAAFFFSVVVCWAHFTVGAELPVFGWVGNASMPTVDEALPMPYDVESMKSPLETVYWPILWSYPFARPFAAMVLLAAVLWITAHAWTLRQVWRKKPPLGMNSELSSAGTSSMNLT